MDAWTGPGPRIILEASLKLGPRVSLLKNFYTGVGSPLFGEALLSGKNFYSGEHLCGGAHNRKN